MLVVGAGGIANFSDWSVNQYSFPYYSSFSINTKGPNYFYPYAEVSTYITSPYAQYAVNFTFYDSVDNSTWVQIPLSDNSNNFTVIGKAPLNSFAIPIYEKLYFPYQNITVQNKTISYEDFTQSIKEQYEYKPLFTPQTTVIFILIIIAVFSFVLQIVDFLFRNEEKKPETSNSKEYSSIGDDM